MTHSYSIALNWTGAAAGPTSSYQAYSREYEYHSGNKPVLRGSADPTFRGDPALYNPEELLVAALASCHLLSYLAECARAGVQVVAYTDDATGEMEKRHGAIRFTSVVLRPTVTISATSDPDMAMVLHHAAHEGCFIANSVNFPVMNEPTIVVAR